MWAWAYKATPPNSNCVAPACDPRQWARRIVERTLLCVLSRVKQPILIEDGRDRFALFRKLICVMKPSGLNGRRGKTIKEGEVETGVRGWFYVCKRRRLPRSRIVAKKGMAGARNPVFIFRTWGETELVSWTS